MEKNGMHISEHEMPVFISIFGLGGLMLVLDTWALWWFGLWRGLRSKTPNRALFGTLVCIIGIPWVALPILAIADSHANSPFPPAWFVLCFVISLVLGIMAKTRMAGGIRQMVNQN